jgi:sulfotransferase family protein
VSGTLLRRSRLRVESAWFRLRLRTHGLRPRDIGLLAGIRKSGNTYLRFLLGNYVALQEDPARGPLSYLELSGRLGETLGWREVTPELSRDQGLGALGIKRFYYTHHSYTRVYDGLKVVSVYRNPLDYLVSFYFYKYAGRPGLETRYTGPQELLFQLDNFFREYTSFLGTSALRIAYEDLHERPAEQLRRVLELFGAPAIDEGLIALAAAHSAPEVIRAEEDRSGPIHSPAGFKGRFVRDGSIGQHRRYFGAAEWQRLEGLAASHGVSLADFRFEPAQAAAASGAR